MMPPKSSDTRLESVEREIEEIRTELQRIPGLERSMEHMAQNVVKLMQTMEETQKAVQSLKTSQAKQKTVADGGEPSSQPEGSPPLGNVREESVGPIGGPRERGRFETQFLGAHGGQGEFGHGIRQLEMPVFNGECPEGWIFRAELYFEMNQLMEMERLMAAGVSFEGGH